MTNEPTTAADKLTYSIEGLCRLVKTTREYQAEYRRLLVDAGKTGAPEDKAAGEKAYMHARSLEKILDQTIDEILADIAEERAAAPPIAPAARVKEYWFYIVIGAILSVVTYLVLNIYYSNLDALLMLAEAFAGIAVTALIGLIGWIWYCACQATKGDHDQY